MQKTMMTNSSTATQQVAANTDHDYAIYPSLLDTYLRFKRTDDDETFSAVFDKINGVRGEQTEVQLKGVEFENLIGVVINANKMKQHDLLRLDSQTYATPNFEFSGSLVNKLATKLSGRSSEQKYLSVIITTKVGRVKLYGIADYEFEAMLADLKTTGNYKVNKYTDPKEIKYTQHLMYSRIKKELGDPLRAFKYVVTDFENDFQETYIPSDNMDFKLMSIIYDFIAFVSYYKSNITDMKVFGQANLLT